jgi:hypothetical protein
MPSPLLLRALLKTEPVLPWGDEEGYSVAATTWTATTTTTTTVQSLHWNPSDVTFLVLYPESIYLLSPLILLFLLLHSFPLSPAYGKGKGKFVPVLFLNWALCHESILGSGGIAPLILRARRYMEVSGQLQAPDAIPPGNEPLLPIG